MGIFSRKQSIEQLEEENERLAIEAQVYDKRTHIEERKSVIKQLKQQYGSSWSKILGVGKMTDLSTLKSFLVGSKKGLSKSVVPESTKRKLWGTLGEVK